MTLETTPGSSPPGPRGPRLLGIPMKQLSLITLTFQNSAVTLIAHYTRMMPSTGDHRYFTSTAVFLAELVKLTIALSFAIYEVSRTLAPSTPVTLIFQQIFNGVFKGDGWKLAIPATLYTLQNILQYVAVENLDPVHYQVILQLKILTTALFTVTILGRSLSPRKWVSLVILTAGVSIVSLPSSSSNDSTIVLPDLSDHFFPRSLHELGQMANGLGDVAHELTKRGAEVLGETGTTLLGKRSASYEGIDDDLNSTPSMDYSIGVSAALSVAALSGLTGVFLEKVFKDPQTSASIWIRNIQLSFYSLISALIVGVVFKDGGEIVTHGFFNGYSWVVWALIVLQAFGGILASLCIHYADNIAKNFATSISIVISFLITVYFFTCEVTASFLMGTALVILATFLYTGPERKRARPPPIRIVSYEKTFIDPISTPLPSDRLEVPGGLGNHRGLGLSTSRPSSPLHLHRSASARGKDRDE